MRKKKRKNNSPQPQKKKKKPKQANYGIGTLQVKKLQETHPPPMCSQWLPLPPPYPLPYTSPTIHTLDIPPKWVSTCNGGWRGLAPHGFQVEERFEGIDVEIMGEKALSKTDGVRSRPTRSDRDTRDNVLLWILQLYSKRQSQSRKIYKTSVRATKPAKALRRGGTCDSRQGFPSLVMRRLICQCRVRIHHRLPTHATLLPSAQARSARAT